LENRCLKIIRGWLPRYPVGTRSLGSRIRLKIVGGSIFLMLVAVLIMARPLSMWLPINQVSSIETRVITGVNEELLITRLSKPVIWDYRVSTEAKVGDNVSIGVYIINHLTKDILVRVNHTFLQGESIAGPISKDLDSDLAAHERGKFENIPVLISKNMDLAQISPNNQRLFILKFGGISSIGTVVVSFSYEGTIFDWETGEEKPLTRGGPIHEVYIEVEEPRFNLMPIIGVIGASGALGLTIYRSLKRSRSQPIFSKPV